GKVTSGGILQVNGTATAGTACSSNGQMAQGPSGPLFCQSGVWRAPAQFTCNANGCYERLQDGLIIQTGFVASSASGFTNWTYPAPFGSGILAVSATIAAKPNAGAPYITQVGASTLNNLPFRATDVNGNNVVYGVSLIAIGY
ncbi:MAG: hypothetical protein WC617_12125, partial [Rhodanobacter sp.]